VVDMLELVASVKLLDALLWRLDAKEVVGVVVVVMADEDDRADNEDDGAVVMMVGGTIREED